jgi:hypothetical protein
MGVFATTTTNDPLTSNPFMGFFQSGRPPGPVLYHVVFFCVSSVLCSRHPPRVYCNNSKRGRCRRGRPRLGLLGVFPREKQLSHIYSSVGHYCRLLVGVTTHKRVYPKAPIPKSAYTQKRLYRKAPIPKSAYTQKHYIKHVLG